MDLTSLPTLDQQKAPMAGEDEVVSAKPVVSAVSIIDNDALLKVNENNYWEPKGAVNIFAVARVGSERMLRELHGNCLSIRQKIWTSFC